MCLKFQTKQKNAYIFTRFSILLRNPRTYLSIALHKQKPVTVLHLFNAGPARKYCGYFLLRQSFLSDLFSDATHLPNHTINNRNLYLTEIRMRIYI